MLKRVLLKISGEALSGKYDAGLDSAMLDYLCEEIKTIYSKVELSIVMGGGNIYRGASGSLQKNIKRSTGDSMGMLATTMNALAIRDCFISNGMNATILGAFSIDGMFEKFSPIKANNLLAQKNIVLIPGGTSNPYFTTDTASVLRALEIEADVILKATNVDGVYDSDPKKHSDAKKYDELTFSLAIEKQLKIMDITAFSMAMHNDLNIRIFDMNKKGNIYKAVIDESIGTLISN